MSYTKQNFTADQYLTADELNAMDNQIFANAEALKNGVVSSIKINGYTKTPNRNGEIDLGIITGDGTVDTTNLATKDDVNAKYTKPEDGIPVKDLDSVVRTALGLAQTSLQEENYKGTVTKVKINGAEKTPDNNGVVDLGTIEVNGNVDLSNYVTNDELENKKYISTGFLSKQGGQYSTALGFGSESTGTASIACGYSTYASGEYSTALGSNNYASGSSSFAVGYNNTASGNTSIVLGSTSKAEGDNSIVLGKENINTHNNAIIVANKCISGADYQIVLGRYNEGKDTNALELGWGDGSANDNGTDTDTTRKNIFEVSKTGDVTIAGHIKHKDGTNEITYSIGNNYGDADDVLVSESYAKNKLLKDYVKKLDKLSFNEFIKDSGRYSSVSAVPKNTFNVNVAYENNTDYYHTPGSNVIVLTRGGKRNSCDRIEINLIDIFDCFYQDESTINSVSTDFPLWNVEIDNTDKLLINSIDISSSTFTDTLHDGNGNIYFNVSTRWGDETYVWPFSIITSN